MVLYATRVTLLVARVMTNTESRQATKPTAALVSFTPMMGDAANLKLRQASAVLPLLSVR